MKGVARRVGLLLALISMASAFAVSAASPSAISLTVSSDRIGTYLAGGLGIYAQPEVWDKDLALAKEAGFGIFRFNSDGWDLLEPSIGHYEFSRLDGIVDKAHQAGVEILFTLPISSSWNREQRSLSLFGQRIAPSHFPTKDIESFRRLCVELAKRYRGKIHYYEVWNEPDFEVFWKGQPDAAEYLLYLRTAYQAIKSIDSSATVLIGGLAKPADATWMKKLLALGGGEFFDAMNIHVYPAFATLDQALSVNRELLKENHLHKKFWITETSTTGGYFDTSNRESEEQAKAEYLVRFFAQALSQADVDKVFWHTLRNPGRDVRMSRDYDFGLMTGDGKPLPALLALKDFMSRLNGAQCAGPDKENGYDFKNKNSLIRVLWMGQGAPRYEVALNTH